MMRVRGAPGPGLVAGWAVAVDAGAGFSSGSTGITIQAMM